MLCALAAPALAQNTKAQINAQIGVNFPDNSQFLITPSNLRTVTQNIVNSIMPTAPVVSGNLACFNGTTGLLQDCGTVPISVPVTVPNGGTGRTSITANSVLIGNGIFSVQLAAPSAVQGCLSSTGASTPPSFGLTSASQCGPVTYVTTIAGLKAIPVGTTASVYVLGYNSAGDGGGGWFYGDALSVLADNGGTIFAPNVGSGRWLRQIAIPQDLSVGWFGARGDGATNDYVAINATVAALPNGGTPSGGVVRFPGGNYLCVNSAGGDKTCLNILNRHGLKFVGTGGSNNAFRFGTTLTFTGATDSLIKLDGCEGIEISNLNLAYNNPSYNGDLIDLRQVSGGIETTSIHIHNFSAGGISGSALSANSLIRMSLNVKVVIEHGFVQYATRGIYGDGGSVNDVDINDIWFQFISSQSLVMGGGNNWVVRNNAVEPLASGNAGWITTSGICLGCTISNNNLGDGNALGTWIDLSAFPFNGGQITSNLASTGLHSLNLGTSSGVLVTGNSFDLPTATGPVIGSGATFANVTANYCFAHAPPAVCPIFSGGFPAGIVDNNDGTGTRITSLVLGSALPIPSGGTGISSYTIGDMIFASGATTLSKLADVATGNALISGGVGVAPSWAKITLATLATQAANTVVANATSGVASPTAFAMPSCSTAASALNWTTNTGFGCNSAITASTMPASGLTGTTLAAQEPAHTGDVTNTAGSLALTYANVVPSTKGGAGSITGALRGNGSGVVTQATCADLSGVAASCSTDATNATNISTGTLAVARGGVDQTALANCSPTIVSQIVGGTPATYTLGSCKWQLLTTKSALIQMEITVANQGVGAGGCILASLPITVLTGWNGGVSGALASGVSLGGIVRQSAFANQVCILKYDSTTVITTGNVIGFSGVVGVN